MDRSIVFFDDAITECRGELDILKTTKLLPKLLEKIAGGLTYIPHTKSPHTTPMASLPSRQIPQTSLITKIYTIKDCY